MRRLVLGLFQIALSEIVENRLADLARPVGSGGMSHSVVPENDVTRIAVAVDGGLTVEMLDMLIVALGANMAVTA